jgi:hypothetical protein
MSSSRAILVFASSISLLACGRQSSLATVPPAGPDPAGRLIQGTLNVPDAASVKVIAANGNSRMWEPLARDGSFSIRLRAERALFRIRFARFEGAKATARGTLVTHGHHLFEIDGNIGLAVDLGSIRTASGDLAPPTAGDCKDQGEKAMVENVTLEANRQVVQEEMCKDQDDDDNDDLCEDCK